MLIGLKPIVLKSDNNRLFQNSIKSVFIVATADYTQYKKDS